MDTKTALTAVQAMIAKKNAELDSILARAEELRTYIKDLSTTEYVLERLVVVKTEKAPEKPERGASVKERIISYFETEDTELSIGDIMAKLGEGFKYGTVVSDIHRLKNKGILVKEVDGKYHLPRNGEGALQGALDIAGSSTVNS